MSFPAVSLIVIASVHDAPLTGCNPDAGTMYAYCTTTLSMGCDALDGASHVTMQLYPPDSFATNAELDTLA